MHNYSSSNVRPRRVCLLERESDLTTAEAAIATQDHALQKIARLRQDKVVRVVQAPGISGSLPPTERPDFDEILNAAERGEFDYVLATEIARVNRGEAYSYYYLKHQLAECGVDLEFLDQTNVDDGESEKGALLEGLAVLLPSIDQRTISRRTKRGKERVREEGYTWCGVPPFGYKYTKGGQRGHRWEVHEAEASWVRLIFAWAAAGISRREIARRLTDAGVTSRRGGKWWASTIGAMIQNPRYKGEWPDRRYGTCKAQGAYVARPNAAQTKHSPGKRLRVRSSHYRRPASEWGKVRERPDLRIVSPELWARANNIAGANKRTAARRSKEPALLKGLIYCEYDHAGKGPRAMIHFQQNHGAPRYHCGFRGGPRGPNGYKSVHGPEMEARVWKLVCDLSLDPESLLSGLIAKCEAAMRRMRRMQAARAEAEAQVRQYEMALANLDVAHAMGEMDDGRYKRAAQIVEGQLEGARKALANASQDCLSAAGADPQNALADALLTQKPGADASPEAAASAVRNAVQAILGQPTLAELEALDGDAKRRRVRQVVERIVYGPEGIFCVLALGAGRVSIVDGSSAVSRRSSPTSSCGNTWAPSIRSSP